jgi:hypothetical protein
MKKDISEILSTKNIATNGLKNVTNAIEQLQQAYNNSRHPGFLDIIKQCEEQKRYFEETLSKLKSEE